MRWMVEGDSARADLRLDDGDPDFAQTPRAERDVLDVIVFYGDPPSDIARYPPEVREELARYLQRVRDYRPRPRPPGVGAEMAMVYAAREGYEGKLLPRRAFRAPSIATL